MVNDLQPLNSSPGRLAGEGLVSWFLSSCEHEKMGRMKR